MSRVATESVDFTLDDGETLTLDQMALLCVYQALLELSPRPGAASVATTVLDASREDVQGSPIELDVLESSAIREAVGLLQAEG
jgi:hypothetical protein